MRETRKQETALSAEGEWVTLTEATKLLDTHRETILKLALAGKLVVDSRGPYMFVSRASIDRYLDAA